MQHLRSHCGPGTSPKRRALLLAPLVGSLLVFVPSLARADDQDEQLEQATVAFIEGEYDQAYPLLRGIAASQTPPARALLYKGLIERERKEFDIAIATFEKGLLDPGDLERSLRLELAVTHSWHKQLDKAILNYHILLDDDPLDHTARNGLARMFMWKGLRRRAQREFESVLQFDPQNTEAQLGLASLARARADGGGARDLYNEVLEREPDNVEAKRGLDEVKTTPRFTTRAGLTYSNLAGRHVGGGHAAFAGKIRESLSLGAGYETSVRQIGDPTLSASADTGIIHQAHAEAFGWLGTRFSYNVQYRALIDAPLHHHSVSLGASVKIAEFLSVGGAVRPGGRSDGQGDLLGRGAVELTPIKRLSLLAMYFGYSNFEGPMSHAAVGQLSVMPTQWLQLRAGGGYNRRGADQGFSVTGGFTVPIETARRDRVEIVGGYQFFRFGFDQHLVSLGTVVNF